MQEVQCKVVLQSTGRLRTLQQPNVPSPAFLTYQQALSDAHTYLFEERERLLALQADCDALRLQVGASCRRLHDYTSMLQAFSMGPNSSTPPPSPNSVLLLPQEVEDRARIKQLLSLTRPVEQRVVYGRDENGPQSSAVFHRGSSSGPSGARNSSGRSGSPGRAQRACCPGGGLPAVPPAPGPPAPERVLRTVYLPTAQSEALALKCEALTAQLAEQKRFAAERVAALTEDRAIRERDAATTAAALSATADQLSQRLRGAEEALRRTTRDYILARQQRDAAQAEAAAARDAAARERAAAADALEDAEQRAAEQLQQLRAELEADARASTEVRGQLKKGWAGGALGRGCGTAVPLQPLPIAGYSHGLPCMGSAPSQSLSCKRCTQQEGAHIRKCNIAMPSHLPSLAGAASRAGSPQRGAPQV